MELQPTGKINPNLPWKILIIDDDEDDFIIARNMLKEARGRRFDIHWANTYTAGREELISNHYHAVLVDYDLGVHSGIELIHEATERGYAAPLILFTGRGSYEVDVEAMQAGATLYLTKGEVNSLLLERAVRYAIERKQVEQNLREREAQLVKTQEDLLKREQMLSVALDAAELGIWTYHFDERVLEMDARAQQLYCAHQAQEDHDAIVRNFVHPDDVPEMWAALSRAADPLNEGRYHAEYRIVQPDGCVRWLNAWGLTEFEDRGGERRAVRLTGASRDITQEKKLLEENRQQKDLLEAVLQSLPVGVWIAVLDGHIIGKNQESDRIWAGDSPMLETVDQYREYQSWDAQSGRKLKVADYPLAKVLRTGQPVEPVEHRIRRFNGSDGYVLVSATPIHDGEGRLMGAVAINLDITGRKKAELELLENARELEKRNEDLQKSEEKFARSFKSSPIALAISTVAEGRFIEVNEQFTALYGFSREELIGHTSVEVGMFPNPEDRQEVVRLFREYGAFRDYEIRLLTKTGQAREVLFSTESVEIDGQECMLSLGLDITHRKQTERALMESQERLELAQQIAHLGSWELDLIHNHLTWSDEVYRIFGLQPQEFAATYEAFLERVHPDDRAAVDAAYGSSLRENRDSYEIEHRIVRQYTGEIRFVHEKCQHFRDPSGLIIRSIGMVHDITERKQAELALRESKRVLKEANDRFQQLANAMPQLVWTTRPDGQIDYFNQRAREYYDIQPEMDGSWTWQHVIHPEDLPATQKAAYRSMELGELYQAEHRIRMADGSYRWHLSRGIPVKDSAGEVVRWYGTTTDIEAQKQTEARLRQSNKELELFAFIASHDLQEPLRKIRLFGDTIQHQLEGKLDPETQDSFDRMINASKRMQEMIHDLLELSRVNTQGRPFMPLDLEQLASEVVSDLEPLLLKTGGRVEIGTLPNIEGDSMQIRLIFQNLFSNGLKFYQPGVPPLVNVSGTIHNSDAGQGQMVAIKVEDNGIGFDEQFFEKILQPFQRLHGRTEYEGTGIGLAIVKKIVDRHSGQISARSCPGKGSTFTILLPLTQDR